MALVHASLLLAFAQAALVTVAPGPADTCPSSTQVTAALETQAPRLVTARPSDPPAMQVTLVISAPLATGDTSIYLLDKSGFVRLYRALPGPPRDHTPDCLALADTVALIVDRYFEEIGLPALPEQPKPAPPPLPTAPPPLPTAPPPPPIAPVAEPPRFALSMSLGRRVPGGAEDLGEPELKFAAAAKVTRSRRPGDGLWIELGAGIAWPANGDWRIGRASGTATAVRSFAELSALWGLAVGRGRLYTGPSATLDLLRVDANTDGKSQGETRLAPALGLRTGYQHVWANRLFLRADLGGHIAVTRYKIVSQSAPSAPIFANPHMFLSLALGMGFYF